MVKRIICAVALFALASTAFAEDSYPSATANEFCVGREATSEKIVSFPCESIPDATDVPAFLAAMRALCPGCFVVLQDVAATRAKKGDKPISVKDLQQLLASDLVVGHLLTIESVYRKMVSRVVSGNKEDEALTADEMATMKIIINDEINDGKRN